jgi:hypothetical protein
MIEFSLKHRSSSSRKKKYPRKEINKGDFKHQSMHDRFKFGYDRNYHYGWLSWKDLNKFFEANLGKNVDKVFSEYIKRAKRFNHGVSLKDTFYDALNPKRRYQEQTYCIDSQNRIAKFKEIKKRIITPKEAYAYNESHYPKDVRSYLKENQIVPFGEFYLREHWYGNWTKKPIYICSKDWYDTVLAIGTGKQFIRMNNMKRVYIPFSKVKAQGVPKNGFETVEVPTGKYMYSKTYPDFSWQIHRTEQVPYSKESNPDFMFFVKGEFNQY